MADVWMTAGVVAAVGAAGLTGWLRLDPAVAVLVAVILLREGWLRTRGARGCVTVTPTAVPGKAHSAR